MDRHRVMLGNIDPDLWARVKAEAALAKKPIAQWVEEVLWEAVEDADDLRVSTERLNDGQGSITYEQVEELLNDARAAVSTGLPKRRVQRARTTPKARPPARPTAHRRLAV